MRKKCVAIIFRYAPNLNKLNKKNPHFPETYEVDFRSSCALSEGRPMSRFTRYARSNQQTIFSSVHLN